MKTSGVKKCLEICAIKGGVVGRLMANAILNFHFDFPGTSLSLTRVPPQATWPKLTCGSYVQSRATGNIFMQLLCATNAEFIRIISLQILSIIVGGAFSMIMWCSVTSMYHMLVCFLCTCSTLLSQNSR